MASLAIALAAALSWWDPAAVQPGQKGICVTEWEGGLRHEIPVEVLGVLDPNAPERTSVLVRLLDDRLLGSGLVQGMSGSPVYVEGKLLGALAWGWAFAREPLGGVTPFSQMHRIAAGGAADAAGATLTQLAQLATGKLAPAALMPRLAHLTGGASLPLAVSGLPAGPEASELLGTL
ncbi:MAG: SpoIVB peptidase S55 domain-containing protein, partial [Acidobacteriota bacterium]